MTARQPVKIKLTMVVTFCLDEVPYLYMLASDKVAYNKFFSIAASTYKEVIYLNVHFPTFQYQPSWHARNGIFLSTYFLTGITSK